MHAMTLGRRFVLLGVTALLLGRCLSADATPVLDQSYVPPGLTKISTVATFQLAQTFTSTVTGQLTRLNVALDLLRGADTRLEIRPVLHGTPVADNTQVLASLPVAPIPATNSLTAFDLTPFALFVHAGDMLAFDLLPGPSTTLLTVSVGDAILAHNPDYPGGEEFFRPSSPLNAPFVSSGPGTDIKFQTLVDPALLPAAVPEPASVVLLVTGLLGALGLRRRQQARRVLARA